MTRKPKAQARQYPKHLAIGWGGPEWMLWYIYDTTVPSQEDDYWTWDAHNGGMLWMGIPTKAEAERIIRTELKDHVSFAAQCYRNLH